MSEPFDYGHFDIVLAEYLQEKKVSKIVWLRKQTYNGHN